MERIRVDVVLNGKNISLLILIWKKNLVLKRNQEGRDRILLQILKG